MAKAIPGTARPAARAREAEAAPAALCPPDGWLALAVAALLGLGVVMVFSSSLYTAGEQQDVQLYLRRELLWLAVSLPVAGAAWLVPPRRWATWVPYLLGTAVALLVLVLVPIPRLTETDPSRAARWIGWRGVTFQPSELAKLAVILYLAHLLDRRADRLHRPGAVLLPAALVVGLVFLLIYREPNFSTAAIIALTAAAMLVAGEVPFRHLLALALPALPVLGYMATAARYRAERLTSFWDPCRVADDAGYQVCQGLYALGSGGLLGVGLGQGKAKFGWLFAAHTDMIFVVIAEELGFLGAAAVLALFALFVWRGYRTALSVPDRFLRLVAFGLTTQVALQAVLNVGVATASLPPTGVPLPFVTYGGSSLVTTLAGVGILLRISCYRQT